MSHFEHFESRRERRLRTHPQWDQVELRLRSGWTPRRVVAWCRERFPGDEPLSSATLYRFIKGKDESWFIPRLKWLELAEEPSPEVLALEQHAALIQTHSARCNESLKLERGLGRPLPEARRNLELLNRMLVEHQGLRWKAGLEQIGSGMVPASADGDPRAQAVELVGRFIQELSTQQFLELMHSAYAREYERHKDEAPSNHKAPVAFLPLRVGTPTAENGTPAY